jgi:plasmid rolling circle replication initiator protein Rep
MKNLVGLWCNLFRGIEIAKTGNYSVSVYFDQEYKNGFDDYKSIKDFCKGWFENFVSDGDIKIEITKPYSYEQKGKWETLEDISARIEKTLKFPKPELKLCDTCETLLKTLIYRLDLSLLQA